jgi:hypothetical protein
MHTKLKLFYNVDSNITHSNATVKSQTLGILHHTSKCMWHEKAMELKKGE